MFVAEWYKNARDKVCDWVNPIMDKGYELLKDYQGLGHEPELLQSELEECLD